MPKAKSLIPDVLVLEKFDVLSSDIQLLPQQVSMILGLSLKQLEVNRSDGKPPRFVKEGGSIRYRVGDVRDYLKRKKVFNNTQEAFHEQRRTMNEFDIS